MKKIFSTLLLSIAFLAANSQTIHWITFIDTTDENVGKIDINGRKILYNHFINEVNAALAQKGYKSNIQDYYGNNVTPQNCKRAVEGLRTTSPDDIIVFYYIGHGGRPNSDANFIKEHPYPQMCLSQWNDKLYIPLEWVDKTLKKKGARLSITIGMCCNNFAPISQKIAPAFSPNYGATYMDNGKIGAIQDLFLGYKGNVLATSAKPGQTSGCLNTDAYGFIDCYTTVLSFIFDNYLSNSANGLTWDNLLDNISSIINSKTNGQQTPIHETHLTKASKPKKSTVSTPSKPDINNTQQQQTANSTKKQGDGNDWVNSLTNQLGDLINVDIPEERRLDMEQDMSSLFADNAVVRMLAQDSEQVIDKEDADVFLGRLSGSRLLMKVAVVEGSFDSNNKIKSLKVREIYKK